MKVYSIVLSSNDGSGQLALYSIAAENVNEAVGKSVIETNSIFGNRNWIVKLKTEVDVGAAKIQEVRTVPVESVEDTTKFTKNFLLNTIVTFLDFALFEASKKYMTEDEVAYIDDKLAIKNENKS